MSIRRPLTVALTAAALVLAPVTLATPAQAAVVKPLDVVSIRYDPPGKDYRTNSQINGEYVVVKNTGKTTLTLTGYQIRDAANHTFVFPKGTKIAPGKSLRIHSGKGTNTASKLFWKQGNFVWNNTGDTLRIYNNKGKLLEKCSYGYVKNRVSAPC